MTSLVDYRRTEMNPESDKEVAKYLAELAVTNPDQLPQALLKIISQRLMLAVMQRLTGILEACVDEFERKVKYAFDNHDKEEL